MSGRLAVIQQPRALDAESQLPSVCIAAQGRWLRWLEPESFENNDLLRNALKEIHAKGTIRCAPQTVRNIPSGESFGNQTQSISLPGDSHHAQDSDTACIIRVFFGGEVFGVEKELASVRPQAG